MKPSVKQGVFILVSISKINRMRPYIKCFKTLLLMAIIIGSATAAFAQGDKLYGYRQAVIPGAAAANKRVIDDAGNVVTERRTEDTRNTYHIYLATTAKTRVYPIEVWINGEAFSARPENGAKTPVEVPSGPGVMGRASNSTLVPKTTQKVTRLIPIPLVADKTSQKAAALAKQAELVVVYKQGGKTYYKTIKTLEALPPVALQ